MPGAVGSELGKPNARIKRTAPASSIANAQVGRNGDPRVSHISCNTRGRAAASPCQVARLGRKSAAIMAGAIALASVAVYARAGAANPDNPAADPVVGVGEICQTTIRLQPGDAQYESCVLSLADSLRSLAGDHALREAQISCLDKGSTPDSGLAECASPSTDADPRSSKSYFYVSQRVVSGREQLSCVRLGLKPGDSAFANCVANLDGRLFAADNPAQ
jgi:hypothetical protein